MLPRVSTDISYPIKSDITRYNPDSCGLRITNVMSVLDDSDDKTDRIPVITNVMSVTEDGNDKTDGASVSPTNSPKQGVRRSLNSAFSADQSKNNCLDTSHQDSDSLMTSDEDRSSEMEDESDQDTSNPPSPHSITSGNRRMVVSLERLSGVEDTSVIHIQDEDEEEELFRDQPSIEIIDDTQSSDDEEVIVVLSDSDD